MKIGLVAADTPNWPKMTWLGQAFEQLGHSVRTCRQSRELQDVDSWADGIVFRHRSIVRWPNLRDWAYRRKSVWIQIWFDLLQNELDLPLHQQPGVQAHIDLMNVMDVIAVKEAVKDTGTVFTPFAYVDQGIPEHLIITNDEQVRPIYDCAFFGQSGEKYPQRARDAGLLARNGFSVVWAGASCGVPTGVEGHQFVHPAELPRWLQCAKVVVSVGRRWDVPWYASDGLYLAMASGVPVIRRATACHPAPVLVYRTENELIDLVGRLIEQDATKYVKDCQVWLRQYRTTKYTAQTLADLIALIAKARAGSQRPDLTGQYIDPAGAAEAVWKQG